MTSRANRREANVDDAIKVIESAIDRLRIDDYQVCASDPKSFV